MDANERSSEAARPNVNDVWERMKVFHTSWNAGSASIADLEDLVQAIAAFNNTTVSVGLLWMMGFTILPPGAQLVCPSCGAAHSPTGPAGTTNGLHPRSHLELVQATEKFR